MCCIVCNAFDGIFLIAAISREIVHVIVCFPTKQRRSITFARILHQQSRIFFTRAILPTVYRRDEEKCTSSFWELRERRGRRKREMYTCNSWHEFRHARSDDGVFTRFRIIRFHFLNFLLMRVTLASEDLNEDGTHYRSLQRREWIFFLLPHWRIPFSQDLQSFCCLLRPGASSCASPQGVCVHVSPL